jgi:hypothetical protein
MLSAGRIIVSLDAFTSTDAYISKRSCLRVTLKGGGVGDDGCTRRLYHARECRDYGRGWRGDTRICYKERMVSELATPRTTPRRTTGVAAR